jgi:hypothetical protein
VLRDLNREVRTSLFRVVLLVNRNSTTNSLLALEHEPHRLRSKDPMVLLVPLGNNVKASPNQVLTSLLSNNSNSVKALEGRMEHPHLVRAK